MSEETEQNEIDQLRDQLNSNYPADRKKAARRVLSMMRNGENVQPLFSDMLRCGQTGDLELKKMIYLYLITYSTQEPEQAIMVVSTFTKDTASDNPVVRALAVRNMCRIKLENVAEHMVIPLKTCLKDPDPYVRKTAAFGASKLYDVIPDTVENSGIFTDLLALLSDENPMVVSNTTAALFEINSHRMTPLFTLDPTTLPPILSTLSSCSEWCQSMLLDALAKYRPISTEDAAFLIDRLIPLLKNANSAVVMGAFKCIFLFMEYDNRTPAQLFPQIIPPFITLVTSAEPEIQYVVLRTLSLFVQRYPKALAKEIRVFFCKYNDPSYVKMEKLDIIVTICHQQTAQLVLDELNEYCNAIDVAFVRKSVRAVGQIAMKIQGAAPRCMDILVAIVGTSSANITSDQKGASGKPEYAIEEAVIVVSDLLRRFPGKFEGVLGSVCQQFDGLHDPRAKAAAIWILGEYCNLIDGIEAIIDSYLDTFHDEQVEVQLQILTTIVKVYLAKPNESRDLLQFALTEATKSDVTPDVRARAFFYWRLLSADENLANKVAIFSKQTVAHSGVQFTPEVLSELIRNMGSVSGVLHIVPSDFVRRITYLNDEEEEELRQWHEVRLRNEDQDKQIKLYIDHDGMNLHVRIVNNGSTTLSDLEIQFDKNAVGLELHVPLKTEIGGGEAREFVFQVNFTPQQLGNFEGSIFRIALFNQRANFIVLGICPIDIIALTLTRGELSRDEYKARWAKIQGEQQVVVENIALANDTDLRARKLFVCAKRENRTYLSLCLPPMPGFFALAEIVETETGLTITLKAECAQQLELVKQNAALLFGQI